MSVKQIERTLNTFFGVKSRMNTRKRKYRIFYSVRVHGETYPIKRTRDYWNRVLWKCDLNGEEYSSSLLRYLIDDIHCWTGDATLVKEREVIPQR